MHLSGELPQFFVQSLLGILAIANPIGAAPIFMGITADIDKRERTRAAYRATIAVFLILTASAFAGRWILDAFSLSLYAFRAAGGLIILLMGMEMIRGKLTRVQHPRVDPEDDTAEDTILVPFAMPIVAGPGAIAAVITMASNCHTVLDHGALASAVLANCLVLLVALLSGAWLERHVSRRAQRIFLRFMGLILLSLGVQFVLAGARDFLSS